MLQSPKFNRSLMNTYCTIFSFCLFKSLFLYFFDIFLVTEVSSHHGTLKSFYPFCICRFLLFFFEVNPTNNLSGSFFCSADQGNTSLQLLDDNRWTSCDKSGAVQKKSRFYCISTVLEACVGKVCCVWKSSLPRPPPPQDARCLLTSLSAVT